MLPPDQKAMVEFGKFDCRATLQGSSCVATCDFGYAASSPGKPSATCQADRSFVVEGACNPIGEVWRLNGFSIQAFTHRHYNQQTAGQYAARSF
jgi:hypothetical protein